MRHHLIAAASCLISQTALAQEYSDLRWPQSPLIAPSDLLCIERAAIELEPTQDAMFDLAQLIVHSVCTGEIYKAIHQTGMADKIDTEKSIDSMVRQAGQAVAAARLLRLGRTQPTAN